MKHDYKPRPRYNTTEASPQIPNSKKPLLVTVTVIIVIAALVGIWSYSHLHKAKSAQKTHVAKTVTIPLKIKS